MGQATDDLERKVPLLGSKELLLFPGKQQLPSRPHQGDLGAAEIGVW